MWPATSAMLAGVALNMTATTNPTPDAAVDVRGVVKHYKGGLVGSLLGRTGVKALQGVDLTVYRGEVFGLLGPNGAGKSTLVKILLGLVRPTRLDGTLLGGRVGKRALMSRVGYLPEQHRFPPYLTGRQVVEFFSALSGFDKALRRKRTGELLDRVGMTHAADRRVNTYSKGMRQRVGLAQALAGSPDLIILDEPTDGVDPLARRDIRDVLGEARDAGTAVMVNSHLLGELELLCDRVAILVNGKVAKQGTLDELAIGSEWYELDMTPPLSPPRMTGALSVDWDDPSMAEAVDEAVDATMHDIVASVPKTPLGMDFRALLDPTRVAAMTLAGRLPIDDGTGADDGAWLRVAYDAVAGRLRMETTDVAVATQVLDRVRGAGVFVRRFAPVRPSLEDVFLSTVAPEPAR